ETKRSNRSIRSAIEKPGLVSQDAGRSCLIRSVAWPRDVADFYFELRRMGKPGKSRIQIFPFSRKCQSGRRIECGRGFRRNQNRFRHTWQERAGAVLEGR